MDIFFVISGFVITYIVRVSPTSPTRFIGKRIARIYPIYYLIFLIVLLKDVFLKHVPVSASDLISSLLLVPVTSSVQAPFIGNAWTLYFEMFFYFCGFLVLCLRGQKYFTPILCAALGLLVLLKPDHYGSLPLVWIATNPIILEFGAGCLIASLYFRIKVPAGWNFLALGAAILWFFYLIRYGYGAIDDCQLILMGTHSFQRVLLFGIPSALLVFFAVNLEKNGFQSWPNFAVKLGDSSYCLYLLHANIIWHPARLFLKWGQKNPDLTIILIIAIVVLIAHQVHCFVERPMQRWIARKFFTKKNSHSSMSEEVSVP